VNTESPTSVSGDTEESSGKEGPKQGSASVNGNGEDGADGQETEFDTETEADGLDGKYILCRSVLLPFSPCLQIHSRCHPRQCLPGSIR
jgi:hypothetical protein